MTRLRIACGRSQVSYHLTSYSWPGGRRIVAELDRGSYTSRPAAHSHSPANIEIVSPRGAGIELTRPTDTHAGIRDHLLPVRDPADGARNGEHHREHRARNTDRAVDEARVEVDVRVELALDEIVVFERNLLQPQRQLEERIVRAPEPCEHFVAHLPDDPGARIEALVDAV